MKNNIKLIIFLIIAILALYLTKSNYGDYALKKSISACVIALKQKSENNVVFYNLENDYINNLYFSWEISKINEKETKIKLQFEILLYSYTIQLLTIYNKNKIIDDILDKFNKFLHNKYGFKEKSLNIVYKEITNG